MPKKRINVIRPTLRQGKRYVLLRFSQEKSKVLDQRSLYTMLSNNFQYAQGIFSLSEAGITIMSFEPSKCLAIVRISDDYLDKFLSSLLFLSTDLGYILVESVKPTLKSLQALEK